MSQVYYCTVHKVRSVSCGDLESKDQRLKIIVFLAVKNPVLHCSVTVCYLSFCAKVYLSVLKLIAIHTLFYSRIWSACIEITKTKYSKPYWSSSLIISYNQKFKAYKVHALYEHLRQLALLASDSNTAIREQAKQCNYDN